MMKTKNEKGTGSLRVGTSAGDHVWAKGQMIHIVGEPTPREISFVMGTGATTNICAKGSGPFPVGDVEYEIVTESAASPPIPSTLAADVKVSLPVRGAVAGLDVGYSDDRKTTGLCVLSWDEEQVNWALKTTTLSAEEREAALIELNPMKQRLSSAAVDGPLAPNLATCTRYRAAEAILSQGVLQKRGKPGQTSAGSGPRLHAEATRLAELALRVMDFDAARHESPIHQKAIVEAFPNLFLGTLCDESSYPKAPARKRKWTDALFPNPPVGAKLQLLLSLFLPGRKVLGRWTINDHDEIAGLTCALTGLCVAAGHFTAVGDDRDGYIFLPPSWAMGTGWPATLRGNLIACLREFPGARIIWQLGWPT